MVLQSVYVVLIVMWTNTCVRCNTCHTLYWYTIWFTRCWRKKERETKWKVLCSIYWCCLSQLYLSYCYKCVWCAPYFFPRNLSAKATAMCCWWRSEWRGSCHFVAVAGHALYFSGDCWSSSCWYMWQLVWEGNKFSFCSFVFYMIFMVAILLKCIFYGPSPSLVCSMMRISLCRDGKCLLYLILGHGYRNWGSPFWSD